MTKIFYQVNAIVYKMVDNKPSFLMLKRVAARGGFWQAITGGIEEGETVSVAAVRELHEETGMLDFLKIIPGVYAFEFKSKGDIGKEQVLGIEVPEWAEVNISNEHSEYRWCNFADALALLKHDTNKTAFKKLFSIIVNLDTTSNSH